MSRRKAWMIVVIVCALILAYPGYLYFSHRIESAKIEKEEQKKEALKNRNDEYATFSYYLEIDGKPTITIDKITIQDMSVDEVKLKKKICFYNHYHQDEVSYDLLMAEFENFCTGDGGYENLISFSDWFETRSFFYYHEISEENIELDIYLDEVSNYQWYLGKGTENLTDDEIVEICENVLEHLDNLVFINKLSKLEYEGEFSYFINDAYGGENIDKLDELGDYRVYDSNGEAYYYEEVYNWMSGENEWRIVKVEKYDSNSGDIFYAKSGQSKTAVMYKLSDTGCGFELVTDEGNRVEYANDMFLIIAEFKDDIFTKISIEVK